MLKNFILQNKNLIAGGVYVTGYIVTNTQLHYYAYNNGKEPDQALFFYFSVTWPITVPILVAVETPDALAKYILKKN